MADCSFDFNSNPTESVRIGRSRDEEDVAADRERIAFLDVGDIGGTAKNGSLKRLHRAVFIDLQTDRFMSKHDSRDRGTASARRRIGHFFGLHVRIENDASCICDYVFKVCHIPYLVSVIAKTPSPLATGFC